MPLPPTDKPAAHARARRPARIALDSPLAAATRAAAGRRRTRQPARDQGLRVVAAFGALLVHLAFLFGFILGPAFEIKPLPPSKDQFMQVRLIEASEPPPPPPMRGTPPKELGPRHQGRVSQQAAPSNQRSASAPLTAASGQPAVEQAAVAPPAPAAAPPVIAQAKKLSAPKPAPAAPTPTLSLPTPAPTAQLQAIPLTSVAPAVALPTPSLQPPVPPKFQPEPVRPAQLEGNRPLPPPASLALPDVPAQAPPIIVSSMALTTAAPGISAPAIVTPARAQLPAAPPVPELQDIPLPAQPAPEVNLHAELSVPIPSVPRERPQVQAPSIDVAEAPLEAIPLAPIAPPHMVPPAPAVKIAVADQAARPVIPSSAVERPELSAPPAATAAATPAQPPASPGNPAESPAPAAAEQAVAAQQTAAASSAPPASTALSNAEASTADRDVSRAPNATPQGSDTATPGEPDGVQAALESAGRHAGEPSPISGQGVAKSASGKAPGAGETGSAQAGAANGDKHGELGGYVQLKPHGNTDVMNHGAPRIGYKPTRFEQDWTPEGESSVDTALRRAVEKTTVSHTLHLPRGVRVKCVVMPLLPMALFGCGNADPPPRPVAEKVYDRLHLAPANPLVPPAPAASSAAPVTMVKLDNTVQCAEARVAGGPPPPDCASANVAAPVLKSGAPAAAGSSWVPASDQFH